jgi:hypothetical protein
MVLVLLAPVWSIGHAQALDHYRGITSRGVDRERLVPKHTDAFDRLISNQTL